MIGKLASELVWQYDAELPRGGLECEAARLHTASMMHLLPRTSPHHPALSSRVPHVSVPARAWVASCTGKQAGGVECVAQRRNPVIAHIVARKRGRERERGRRQRRRRLRTSPHPQTRARACAHATYFKIQPVLLQSFDAVLEGPAQFRAASTEPSTVLHRRKVDLRHGCLARPPSGPGVNDLPHPAAVGYRIAGGRDIREGLRPISQHCYRGRLRIKNGYSLPRQRGTRSERVLQVAVRKSGRKQRRGMRVCCDTQERVRLLE